MATKGVYKEISGSVVASTRPGLPINGGYSELETNSTTNEKAVHGSFIAGEEVSSAYSARAREEELAESLAKTGERVDTSVSFFATTQSSSTAQSETLAVEMEPLDIFDLGVSETNTGQTDVSKVEAHLDSKEESASTLASTSMFEELHRKEYSEDNLTETTVTAEGKEGFDPEPTQEEHKIAKIETTVQVEQEQMDSTSGKQKEQLVIGLDFGTTYSGVAYGFTSSPESEPICIQDWPGRAGRELVKVPTVVRYHDDGSFQWGYEIEETSAEKLEGIKLLLDPDQLQQTFALNLAGTKAALKKLEKSAVDIAADFIGAIYKHAIAKIVESWPRDYIEGLERVFVLSVPAIWSDRAKDLTRMVTTLSLSYLRLAANTTCFRPLNVQVSSPFRL